MLLWLLESNRMSCKSRTALISGLLTSLRAWHICSHRQLHSQHARDLAGFFVVYHFFGLPPTATLAELEREGRRHCAVDWEPLHAARGAEIQMDQYCFR